MQSNKINEETRKAERKVQKLVKTYSWKLIQRVKRTDIQLMLKPTTVTNKY